MERIKCDGVASRLDGRFHRRRPKPLESRRDQVGDWPGAGPAGRGRGRRRPMSGRPRWVGPPGGRMIYGRAGSTAGALEPPRLGA